MRGFVHFIFPFNYEGNNYRVCNCLFKKSLSFFWCFIQNISTEGLLLVYDDSIINEEEILIYVVTVKSSIASAYP